MKIFGIPVCAGKVLQKACVLRSIPRFDMEKRSVLSPEDARAQVNQAIAQVSAQLAQAMTETTGDDAQFIEVQCTMLEESDFLEEITLHINAGLAPEAAVLRAAKTQEELLLSLNDSYLSARAEDMHDVSCRVACLLTGTSYPDISCLEEPVIVVAEELLPTMLMGADMKNLSGIIIQKGTRTSHVSILAASLDIPTVVGCGRAMELPAGETLFLDSEAGEVHYGLDSFEEQKQLTALYRQEKQQLLTYCSKPALSADDTRLCVLANIVEPIVLDKVNEQGLDGVGLFRTEFMYMNRSSPPNEEEQFAVYKMAVQKLGGKPLTIRTMDIGGDKMVDYLNIPQEGNPFMGFRAIRICLKRTELFKVQLRAILRASAFGSVKLMFPMIAIKKELLGALTILEECKQELRISGTSFDEALSIGIMVEIPSAALMLDQMTSLISFVSIGSNDLVQYTYAADRLNPAVEYLYNFLEPAVLRLIAHTIRTARQAGIECSLCGEMAGDAAGLAMLAALGLEKFSVSPSLGLITKKRLRLLTLSTLTQAGKQILQAGTSEEAVAVLRQALPPDYQAMITL